MKFKNIRDFAKKINGNRIIQAGIVWLGTLLIAEYALQTSEVEVTNDVSKEMEWNVQGDSILNHNKKEIRDYENGKRSYEENEMFFAREMEFSIYSAIAREVIRGEYGNGEERKQRLEEAGYDYETIRSLVNDWYDRQESYQYMEPLVESTFTEDGKFVKKSGYSITYLDEFGDKQISYYNNNGKLLYTTETEENYQNSYPIIDDAFTLSEDGKFIIKSGFSITYLNENGDKQISYYDNNGNLLSTSEDYENYR